jgi:DNA end-binding protein Ku
MARQLIEAQATDFDPTKYRDEYRERVLDLIERKAAGEEIAVQPMVEERQDVPDLMAALEQSLAAARGRKPAAAKNGGTRKPAKAGAKRAATAKKKASGSAKTAKPKKTAKPRAGTRS